MYLLSTNLDFARTAPNITAVGRGAKLRFTLTICGALRTSHYNFVLVVRAQVHLELWELLFTEVAPLCYPGAACW